MKEFKKLFTVSFKNLKCHKRLNARIVIALSVFMFIICLFSVFYVSTGLMYARYPAEHVSTNYIFSQEEITDLPEGTQLSIIKNGDYSSRLINIFGERQQGQLSPYILFYDRINMELEGKEYQFYRNNFLDYLGASSNFNVYSLSENFFTENDYAELKLRFGLDSFIIGELPQTSNEILISAEMLGYQECEVFEGERTLTYVTRENTARHRSTKYIGNVAVAITKPRETHRAIYLLLSFNCEVTFTRLPFRLVG